MSPDPVVESVSVSASDVEAGERFTLYATVLNQGDGPSVSTTLRYYLSDDASITPEDYEVDMERVRSLASTEIMQQSAGLAAPTAGGTYYYGGCVDSVPREYYTRNNCSDAVRVTVRGKPDLVVNAPSVSDESLDAEERVTLSVTVVNHGDGPSDSTTLRYYVSDDASITLEDSELSKEEMHGLPSAGAAIWEIGLTAPTAGGTYYYGGCVDSVPRESDTTEQLLRRGEGDCQR